MKKIPLIKGYSYVEFSTCFLIYDETGRTAKTVMKNNSLKKENLIQEVEQHRLYRAVLKKEEKIPFNVRILQKPDPNAPTELGWRMWLWSREGLISPYILTFWELPELETKKWVDSHEVSDVPGIHAYRLPKDWLKAGIPYDFTCPSLVYNSPRYVTGVVERFGKYALGKRGWRAEKVVIRELCAPTTKVMLELMEFYPEVKVHLSPYAKE